MDAWHITKPLPGAQAGGTHLCGQGGGGVVGEAAGQQHPKLDGKSWQDPHRN